MRALDKKLFRDLRRLWIQALAIALVIAGGVATFVLAGGSLRTLEDTRDAYYERYRFADVFALVRRAPRTLGDRIAEIPGVSAVETRIAKFALLDVPNAREPATGQFISVPEGGEPLLNRPYLRSGRMPEAGRAAEVVISESFAKAHELTPGSQFSAILNGRKRLLDVVGIALSPEFIYAIGPGDIMPDERRYGIVWMSEMALANVFDLDGAFSSVSLKLLPGASEREVIRRLDGLLDRFGGQAAYGRKDQISHAFLDHGFDMLKSVGRTLPPIFLLVAAFLINLILGRLIALEREQIGLLKAVGYSDFAIASHYVKFVLVIAVIGIVIGGAAGTPLATYVANIFGNYYHFPFLIFSINLDVYLTAAVLSIIAAIAGALRAVRDIVALAPAVAMQPPAPPRFRRLLPIGFGFVRVLSQPTRMMLRSIARRPLRAVLTVLAIAFATAILTASRFTSDAMEPMIDVTYFQADRQDATLNFIERRSQAILNDVARLPGILAVEPHREVPVRIRSGHAERRVMLSGKPRNAGLSRIIDVDLRPVALPEVGLALSEMLAQILNVRVGDFVEVDLLEGSRRTVFLPVAALVEDYLGLRAMMDIEALSRLMREAPSANGINLIVDGKSLDLLYDVLKTMPAISGIALQRVSLEKFREALGVNLTVTATIYTVLAAIIAFGVVYNSARISLSERARELASLRVLGFTRAEVSRILLMELALVTLVAQLPGWAIGYAIAWIIKVSVAGELMRIPMVIENQTYVLASLIVVIAAVLSALIVIGRVNRLDLVAVLKTRD